MVNSYKKFLQEAKSVRLTVAEKEQARGALLRHMQAHPLEDAVRNGEDMRLQERTSFWSSFFTLLTPRPMPALIILLIVALSGGGVSYAANNSLPGDFLYPVKVSVNEEVRSAFTFSPESEIEWEIERSERRLSEAAELDARGELETDVATSLMARVENHNEAIQELETELEARGENEIVADLRAQYDARLQAYESLVYQLLSESRPIAVTVAANVEVANDERNIEESTMDTDVASKLEFSVNLTDLIEEARLENRLENRDASGEAEYRGGGAPANFEYQATQAMQKAKAVYINTRNTIESFAEAEGRELFEKPLRKLEEAQTIWSKGTVEFEAGRFAAAYAHFNTSINFSNHAENLARQIMVDLEQQSLNDQVVQPMQKAKAIYYQTKEGIESLAKAEGRKPFDKAFDILEEALNAYTKGLSEFESRQWGAAMNAFETSIRLSNQAQGIASRVMADLEQQGEAGGPVLPVPNFNATPEATPEATRLGEQPERRFQEILPGDEQYAPDAEHSGRILKETITSLEASLKEYARLTVQDLPMGYDRLAKLLEDIRALYQEGQGYLEIKNYYWSYVNLKEGMRLANDFVNLYQELNSAETHDKGKDDAVNARIRAESQLRDAQDCLNGLSERLGEAIVANARSYLNAAESAFGVALDLFENGDFKGASENYSYAYDSALKAYTLGQEIKKQDKEARGEDEL